LARIHKLEYLILNQRIELPDYDPVGSNPKGYRFRAEEDIRGLWQVFSGFEYPIVPTSGADGAD
jgi:hypothetical protein